MRVKAVKPGFIGDHSKAGRTGAVMGCMSSAQHRCDTDGHRISLGWSSCFSVSHAIFQIFPAGPTLLRSGTSGLDYSEDRWKARPWEFRPCADDAPNATGRIGFTVPAVANFVCPGWLISHFIGVFKCF